MFKDKTILITGGTGFLGRNLTRRILEQNPQSIRIYSRDEYQHYRMQEEFNNDLRIRNLIGDVRDYPRLKKAMSGVDIVIHVAALKRIDLIEYNVSEVIKTNILGTLNVVDACLNENVEKAIFISTDKACMPVNTYGATKFVGERIFRESNFSKGPARTIFASVRYGNVLESTGSVIPFFIEKIMKNQEIPLTDERMTRFMITVDKAIDLIFNALNIAKGGEVFVPKLNSFRIVDMIKVLKDYYDSESKIKIIGIRPGEKIHELMINESEVPKTYDLEDFYMITSQIEKYSDITYDIPKQKLVNLKNLSSESTLISADELKEYLIKEKILNKI